MATEDWGLCGPVRRAYEEDSMADSRGHMPDGKWEFDAEVTECFEDMLRRSIPQYDVMRDVVHTLACRAMRTRKPPTGAGLVVDLGCSNGLSLERLVHEFGTMARYVGVDVSEPMLRAAAERFRPLAGVVDIANCDLRTSWPDVWQADVTLAVLTLQFIPINYRSRIIKKVFDHTRPDGTFILVEKVLGATAETDEMMVDIYHQQKVAAGYSVEEVDRKRAALEGVLVPVTARWNEELLTRAGFVDVECVWRWMNFAAWSARRPNQDGS